MDIVHGRQLTTGPALGSKSNEQLEVSYESEVMNMYQIYGLLTIVVLLWSITIWASIPEEEEGR
jgi:hypothetical protein